MFSYLRERLVCKSFKLGNITNMKHCAIILAALLSLLIPMQSWGYVASGIGSITCKEATLFVEENGADGFQPQLINYFQGFRTGKEWFEKGEVKADVDSYEQLFLFVMNTCFKKENSDKPLVWILNIFYEQLETDVILK